MSARRCSHPADATELSGHSSKGHLCTVLISSSSGSSSEASNSSLRSTRIVLLFGAGVTAAEEDEEDEVEDPATRTLRASGVYRLMARFFRLPLPRFSSALSGSSLTQEFERSVVEEEEEEELVWFMLSNTAAARALISSGEIYLEEPPSPGGRAWYVAIRRSSSAVKFAFGGILQGQ